MTTRNIVPQNDNEGELGVQSKRWSKAHINNIESTSLNSTNADIDVLTSTNIDTTDIIANTIKTENFTVNDTAISFNFIKRNTSYKVGDVAYNSKLKSYLRLECIQSGTTANTEPTGYTTINTGEYIVDGVTKWIACDLRDGLSLGDIAYRPFLKEGYVKLNGATVQRNDYPRLVQYATDNNLWTSSPSTEAWKFGQGDGDSTFVLPDYRNRFIEGGDSVSVKEAGLPNITGKFGTVTPFNHSKYCMGAFGTADFGITDRDTKDAEVALNTVCYGYDFNASRSNTIYGKSSTVQPPAITLIPQIKY